MRLYRGEGATRPVDPRSTVGRYWTDDLETAEAFAAAMDGRVFVVDVDPSELPPAITVGRSREYLISRSIADSKIPLDTSTDRV